MKPLEQLTNKTYLASLLNNKEEFLNDIEESSGYVLHLMEKEKLFPPLEWLMSEQEANLYALSFIIKNYDLEKAQLRSLKKYFSYYADNIVSNESLEEDEVKESFVSGEAMTRETVLSFDFIMNNVKEIINYDKRGEHNYIGKVLDNSVNKMTPEQIFQLPKMFLSYFISEIFSSVPEYFNDRAFAREFKNLLMEMNWVKHDIRLSIFDNYIMDEKEDTDLFEKMIKEIPENIWSSGYEDWIKIKGMDSFLSAMYFIEHKNPASIKMMSDTTTLENKERLQEILRTKFFENQPYDKDPQLNTFFRLDSSLEQFKIVIDLDFLRDFIEKHPHRSWVRTPDFDSDRNREKISYMNRLMLKLIAEDNKYLDLLSGYDLDRIFSDELDTYQKTYGQKDPEMVDVFLKSYANIIDKMISTEYQINENSTSIARDIARMTKNSELMDVLIDKASPNLLYCLSSQFASERDSKKNYYRDEQNVIKELLQVIAPRVDKKTVKEMSKYFDIKYKLPLLAVHDKLSTQENNMLAYTLDEALNDNHYEILFNFYPAYQQEVLKEKKRLPEDVLLSLFREAENSKEKQKYFIQYTSIHREELLKNKNFTNAILASHYGQNLFPIEVKQQEQDSIINEILTLDNEYQKISEKQDAFSEKYENSRIRRSREYYETEEYKTFEQEKRVLSKQIDEMKKLLSSEVLENLAIDLLTQKEYDKFSRFNHLFRYNKNVFAQYTNTLSYTEMKGALNHPSYEKLFKESVNYDGNTSIQLNFSDKEVMELSQTFYDKKLFEMKSLFAFYPKEQVQRVAKMFLINHAPFEAIYDYTFRPNEGEKSKVTPYTKEEVINIFHTLNEGDGAVYGKDANSHHSLYSFIKYNYKNNEKALLEFIEYAKKEPIAYMIASYHETYNDYLRNEKYKADTLDASKANYFKAHFDFEIVLKGVKEIFDNLEKNKGKIEDELYYSLERQTASVIDRVIWTTYYDTENYQTGEKKHYPTITQEQSDRFITLLREKAPMYLMIQSKIGVYENLPKHINENFAQYELGNMNAHDFAYPKHKVAGDNFSISGNGWATKNIGYSIEGYVNALINEDKMQELNYLSFLAQQRQFEESQLDYSYRPMSSSSIIEYIVHDTTEKENYFALNEKLQACSRKFFMDRLLEQKTLTPNPVKKRSNKI